MSHPRPPNGAFPLPPASKQPVDSAHSAHPPHAAKVAISRDEVWLACACGEEVKILDRETGVVRATIPSDTSAVYTMAWHPRKSQLAVSTASLQIRLWDIDLLTAPAADGSDDGAPQAMPAHTLC